MSGDIPKVPELYTPAEVAALFRVDVKTVTRWAATRKIRRIRLPGGRYRFRKDVVDALLAGDDLEVETR